jgi:hypothetical protein
MIKIEVKGIAQVQAKLAGIRRDMQAKVLQPAINKVADKARAEINRAIPQEYNVKASEVRNAVTLRRAQAGRLEAVISVFGSARKRGRSMNLIHFLQTVVQAGEQIKLRGAKGKKSEMAALQKQLGFLIKKGGGLKKIEGAFVGNKGRTIFRRTGNARLPIEPLQVIGFSQMFKSRKIEQRIMEKIAAEFPVEIDRAIKRLMA